VTDISQAGPDGAAPGAPAGNSPPPSQPSDNAQQQQKSEAIPLAVDIGWTMAVLFGSVRPAFVVSQPAVTDRLPTEHELSVPDRGNLEQTRVNALLARLGDLITDGPDPRPGIPHVELSGIPDAAAAPAADAVPAPAPAPDAAQAPNPAPEANPAPAVVGDDEILRQRNFDILQWLASAGREYGIAYQLGRSLRDTANMPLRPDAAKLAAAKPEIDARIAVLTKQPTGNLAPADQAQWEFTARDALNNQLSRTRVSAVQDWLSSLQPYLPADSAAIVSVSIGRWGDLTSTIFDPNAPGSLRKFNSRSQLDVAGEMTNNLLPQGDAWINLLTGAQSSEGLLSPEGFVAAGESALSRTARIIGKIVTHYWLVLVILLIALGGVLYFAESGIKGAGRAWTEIAAVASALGVTWKGITTAAARLSAEAEKPIFGLEKIDAMAWAVTTIPSQLPLNAAGVRALRRAGITPPGPMGRS
jgi:hypothetical protein